MKTLLLALALCLLAAPAAALTQREATDLVADTGCTADVVTIAAPEMSGFNAFYSWSHHIGLINFDRIPRSWQLLILYHESWHCLQRMHYGFPGGHATEWDADGYAISRLSDHGLDGAEVNAGLWAYVYNATGYLGEDAEVHGLVTHRIMRGWLNRAAAHVEGA